LSTRQTHQLAATIEAELVASVELVAALEMAGSVADEDKATLRRALAEAKAAGVGVATVAEAEAVLRRLEPGRRLGSGFEADDSQAAKRRRLQGGVASAAGAGAGTAVPGSTASPSLRRWAVCLVEAAVLKRRKQEAVENEDFDLALEVKRREADVAKRLEQARQSCQAQSGGGSGGAPDPALVAELEGLKAQKAQAVEQEDFALAAELRKRERAVEQQLQSGQGSSTGGGGGAEEAEVFQEVLRLLEVEGMQVWLAEADPGVTACVQDAIPALWRAVASDLGASATAS